MDSYLVMRKRFANVYCEMMDYDLKTEDNPRCLMISSALLMESAHSVMKRAYDSIFSQKNAKFNPESNKINPKDYEEFLNSIGGTALFVWNMFQKGVKDRADAETFVKLIEKLSKNLKMLSDFSKRMVSQYGQKYMIMSDENLKDTVSQFLHILESKQIIESVEELGAKDVARKMEGYKKEILRNIEKAEKTSQALAKNKGKDFKPLDLEGIEEVTMLRERAASEDKEEIF